MKWFLSAIALAGLLLAAAAPGFAQTRKKSDRAPAASTNNKATKKKPRKFLFDPEDVDGRRAQGYGDVVGALRHPAPTSLIRVREHFIPEILRSADNL